MLPKTLALIDDDEEFRDGLARHLGKLCPQVTAFADSNELLAHPGVFDFEFYVTDLMLPGVQGLELIKVLRRRTEAGIVVVSGRLSPDTFKDTITAGADMVLGKPVQFEQVGLVVEAVQRRAGAGDPQHQVWRLDRRLHRLVAPDGAQVDLSEVDVALLACFADAQGAVVPRETLLQSLGKDTAQGASGGLNAIVFRLRRRIERATPVAVPLQTKSGVGYAFRAQLTVL